MFKGSRILALAVSSPNLLESLVGAATKLKYPDEISVLDRTKDWEKNPVLNRDHCILELAIVDATVLFDSALDSKLRVLSRFSEIAIFNTDLLSNTHVEKLRDWGALRTRATFYGDILTSEVMISKYRDLIFSRADVDVKAKLNRRAASEEHAYVIPPHREDAPSTGALTKHLRSRIHLHPSRLKNEFVNDTLRNSPAELVHLEQRIRRIIKRETADFSGVLVKGDRGVGKTTMCYFIGVTEKTPDTCFIPVDFSYVKHDLQTAESHLGKLARFADDRLRDYAAREDSIESKLTDVVKKNLSRSYFSDLPKWIVEEVSDGSNDVSRAAAYSEFGPRGGFSPIISRQSFTQTDAENWFENQIFSAPADLFAAYLLTIMRMAASGTDRYTMISMICSLAKSDDPAIARVLKQAAVDSEDSNIAATLASKSPSDVWSQLMDREPSRLMKFFRRAMQLLGEEKHVIIALDNIDQRPDERLEAIIVERVTGLVSHAIRQCIPHLTVLLAMRESTFLQQRWIQTPLDGWEHIDVAPASLLEILSRRIQSWYEAGSEMGPAIVFSRRVNRLLNSWSEQKQSTGGRVDDVSQYDRIKHFNIVDIITKRHPQNIGEQLAEFSRCYQNPLFQAILPSSKLQGETEDPDPWFKNRSFEYHLRIFLTGEKRFFNELDGRVLNIFDSGFHDHPLNSSIRYWVLSHIANNPTTTPRQTTDHFCEAGIDSNIVERALESMFHFDLIRYSSKESRDGYRRDPTAAVKMSKWGEFFHKQIALDLPYISTVWWCTPIAQHFDMGEPFIPTGRQLREPAGEFLRWLRFEENVAMQHLSKKLTVPSIFEEASYRVYHSLNRIEQYFS